jgi:hypothetical protein
MVAKETLALVLVATLLAFSVTGWWLFFHAARRLLDERKAAREYTARLRRALINADVRYSVALEDLAHGQNNPPRH